MKKLVLGLLLTLLLAAPASAKVDVKVLTLDDANGTRLADYSLTTGNAVYSEAIDVSQDMGVRAILVTEDQSGGAGDVDISVQYSIDGTNFYDAYTDDSGTLTVDDNIATGLGNATRYIYFSARIAPYIRFKFDPDSNSEITVHFIYLRDR